MAYTLIIYFMLCNTCSFNILYVSVCRHEDVIFIMCFYLYRRNHKPLGRIRIGPNQLHDNQHWEKMTKKHGTLVTMVHNIGDV